MLLISNLFHLYTSIYSNIWPHKGPTTIVMQVKLNILAYYVTYIMYIFLFLFTCIVHISSPSPKFACHGIYINSIIYIYLPLAHNYFIKTTLYFDLDDQISLTSRNSSHCFSYVVYSNLTSYYDNG